MNKCCNLSSLPRAHKRESKKKNNLDWMRILRDYLRSRKYFCEINYLFLQTVVLALLMSIVHSTNESAINRTIKPR